MSKKVALALVRVIATFWALNYLLVSFVRDSEKDFRRALTWTHSWQSVSLGFHILILTANARLYRLFFPPGEYIQE